MNYLHHIKSRHLLPEGSPEYLQLAAFLGRFRNDRYGEGHILFAAIAAFPVFLTPELLYKLWLNFQTYRDGANSKQKIHRIAVSDLLLSGLLREVAVEIYEMQPSIRTALLSCLEQRFRDKRDILRELAEFMLYYVRSYQLEGESITTTVREAQEWNALAYVDPAAAVRQVREALSGAIRAGSATQQLRINLLLQRLDEQYARTNKATHNLNAFRTLVDYSRGMSEFIRGNHQEALQRFQTLERQSSGSTATGAGLKRVHMPIPKTIYEGLRSTEAASEVPETEQGRVFALFVGIDAYPNLPPLRGSTRDANEMSYFVSQFVPEERLVTNTILDAAAHKKLFLDNLQDYLKQATSEDVVLVYFAGHGENRRQGAERNRLFFYEYNPQGEPEESLRDDEFYQLISEFAVHDPSIVLLLDTHAGSDLWLDSQNDKHLILTACGEEEVAHEAEEGGIFTKNLVSNLKNSNGRITYRQLIRNTRAKLSSSFEQLPQLLGRKSASLRLFLSNHYSPLPQMQELLREAGYYEGAIDENAEAATEEALQRFQEEWQLEEAEPMKAVQQKIVADRREELRVLVVTGYEPNRINQALASSLDSITFPIKPVRFRPPSVQQSSSQKFEAQEEDGFQAARRRVDEADFVIMLIDDFLIRNEATTAVVDRILQWRQTDFLPVVPLLIQKCDWERHAVADLPGMELYRMKGNFLNAEWITTTGMDMIREEMEGIGRFKIDPVQRDYLSLSRRYDPDMPWEDMEKLIAELRSKAGQLKEIDFLTNNLNTETPKNRILAAAVALQVLPVTPGRLRSLMTFLREIIDKERLTKYRRNVLYHLLFACDGMIRQDNEKSTPVIDHEMRRQLTDLLLAFDEAQIIAFDKGDEKNDLSALIYSLIPETIQPFEGNAANFWFSSGTLSKALIYEQVSASELNLPAPEAACRDYLKECEQFDGEMSVNDMDKLGSGLQSQAASIPNFHFLVDRLRPDLFQGYIFGAAKGIEAQPEVRYFGPLLGYLDRIAQTEDLNYDNLRLRVLYRLLMGLEAIIEKDNQKDSPEIDPEMRQKTISVLEAIRDNPRAVEDTKRHKGKGIGGRVEQIIGKLHPPEEAVQTQTMEGNAESESTETDESLLRRALFELDFTLQLEVARKEVDIGAPVVPIIAPAPLAAGPGLLRDRLCSEFNLPPEWLVTLDLAEAMSYTSYSWTGNWIIRSVLDQLHLNAKSEELEEFAELLAREYTHSEIVISLENRGSQPLQTTAEFLNNWLDFADQLVRMINTRRSDGGLRRVWLFLISDELPPVENDNWYINPVTLPPVERVDEKELERWLRNLPDDYLKKLYGKFLPSYRPMWPLEVIREVCRELEMEEVYLNYFVEYEPPGNGTHPPVS